jgi:hypothetical protein
MHNRERSLVQRYRDKPFVIIGVGVDRDYETFQETVRDYIQREQPLPGVSIYDRNRRTVPNWSVQGTPTLFLVDAEGVVRDRQEGTTRVEYLEKAIDGLLPEKK